MGQLISVDGETIPELQKSESYIACGDKNKGGKQGMEYLILPRGVQVRVLRNRKYFFKYPFNHFMFSN